MTARKNTIAAIDVGTTKIVAIIAEVLENGKLEIIGLGKESSYGVRRGVVLNIEETVKGIKSAVNKAEQQAKTKMRDVYVGIAGQHIRSLRASGYIIRESTENEISQKDIEKLILSMQSTPVNPGEEILHILPQNYTVDNEMGIKNPTGMSGKKLAANFHIVVGDVDSANQLKKCITKAGLTVKKIILEPLASSNAVLTDDEKEVGVALIEIGGGTTDIAVYVDGTIQHTAVIPLGGNNVTDDLKKMLNILERHAETIKVQCGHAICDDKSIANKKVSIKGINERPSREIRFTKIAAVIQARMEEIIERAVFQLFSAEVVDKLGAGIVITGGGSLLKSTIQLVAFKSECDVRLGYPKVSSVSENQMEITSPIYATSVGLLMCGLEEPCKEEKNEYHDEENTIDKSNIEGNIPKPKSNFGQKVRGLFGKILENIPGPDVEENDDMNKKI